MIRISRDWATPLTIGTFGVMAVTGGLMFFHLDTGLNKVAHEWLGWAMVAAVAAHVLVNWPAFRRYLTSVPKARVLLALSAVVLAATFISPGGQAGGASVPALAINAITAAPLDAVAGLAGKPVDQVLKDLQSAGIPAERGDQTLGALVAGDREKVGRALSVLFAKPAG